MAGLLDGLMEQLGGDRLGDIAGALGGDSGATQAAITSALPALLGGLANNTSNSDGATALRSALDDHDGSVLDDPGAVLAGQGEGDGAQFLADTGGERPRARRVGEPHRGG